MTPNEMAEKLAIRCNANKIFDFIKLTPEYSIYEIPIEPSWEGKSIANLEIRRKYGINIIAIKQDATRNQKSKTTTIESQNAKKDLWFVFFGT